MKQKMETSALNQKIESLFNEKMNQQSKYQSTKQRVKKQYESQQTYLFYGHFEEEINNVKNKIFKVLQEQLSQFTIQQIKKTRSKILPLLRDLRYLLDDGILDFFYQFSEIEKQTQRQQVKKLAKKMLEISEPIIRKFFIHKEFVRMKAVQKNNAAKKQNFQRRSSRQKTSIRNSVNLTIKIQVIEELYQNFTVEQLIKKHLENQQQSMDSISQKCRICKKSINLNHLLKHLHYCEKRQSLKKKISKLQKKINTIQFSLQKRALVINYRENRTEQQISFQKIYKKIFKLNNNSSSYHHRRISLTTNKDSFKSIFQIAKEIENHAYNFGIDADLQMFRRFKLQKDQILRKIQKLQKEQFDGSGSCSSFQSFSSSRESSKQNIEERKAYKKSTFLKSKSSSSSSQQKQLYIVDQKQLQQSLRKKNKNKTIRLNRSILNSVNTGRSKSSQSISHRQNSYKQFEENQKQNDDNYVNNKQLVRIRKQSFITQISQKKQTEHKQQQFKPSRFKTTRKSNKKTTIHDNCLDIFNQQSPIKNRATLTHEQLPNHMQREEVQQTLNNFQFLSFLGKGAFGKVYLARRKDTLDLYAIKIIIMQEGWEQNELKLIKNQYQTFKHIGGDHLVKAPFAFSSYNGFFFVMEYMPGGDLGKLLSQQCYLNQDTAKFYLAEIVLAIQLLHEYKIIHRDLKPENLVFDQRGHLKLTDFGLSEARINDKIEKVKRQSDQYKMELKNKIIYDKKRGRKRRSALIQGKNQIRLIGTPDYIAPQIINGTSTTNQTIDWWSFGIMAYQILIGARPFAGDTIEQVITNILQYNIQWPEEGMISPEAKDFILKLTQRNYMTRLGSNGSQQIKKHSFFQGIDWQNINQQTPPQKVISSISLQIYDKEENKEIREQIQKQIGYRSQRGSSHSKGDSSTPNKAKFRLSNFVRFDILQYQTFESAQKMLNKKNTKIKKLKSLIDNFKQKEQFIKIQEVEDSPDQIGSFDKFKSSQEIHIIKDDDEVL